MKESNSNWRKVYKALNVLDYCIKNGTKRFVEECRECLHKIQDLKSFQYTEPDTGKDQGINVREKAKQLIELLSSTERLTEEREKARRARERFHNDKMGGFSSEDYRSGGGKFDDDGGFDKKKDDEDDFGGFGQKKDEAKKREPKSIQDDDDDWGEPKGGAGGGGGGGGGAMKITIKPLKTSTDSKPKPSQGDLLDMGGGASSQAAAGADDAWADFGDDPFGDSNANGTLSTLYPGP